MQRYNITKALGLVSLTSVQAPLLVYTPHILRGAYNGFAASRLSYAFDLRGTTHTLILITFCHLSLHSIIGPCMLVDTACSSSANCVYLGMQAIRNGEATMAIAAGVNIINIQQILSYILFNIHFIYSLIYSLLYPPFSNMMRVMGVLSSDGTSKPFSADADGWVNMNFIL